jgi:lipoic acid synthetase
MQAHEVLVSISPVQIGRGRKAFRHRRLPRECVRPQGVRPPLQRLERIMRALGLHTVCEEARCPNRPECWSRRAVTFMLLGDVCTRACRFCAVATGKPFPPDPAEPSRVARATAELSLSHVVLTSVNRDELPDGGSQQFARTLRAIREIRIGATVEVLTPDFRGDLSAVATVCGAEPDVYNHNVETVPRLYRRVRPGADFQRSLAVLAEAKRLRPDSIVKSGLMVGLGEAIGEVIEVLRALRSVGVDTVTVGQYLRPSRDHLEVERYWELREFQEVAAHGGALGLSHVASGPLIRSSYNAGETLSAIREDREALAAS